MPLITLVYRSVFLTLQLVSYLYYVNPDVYMWLAWSEAVTTSGRGSNYTWQCWTRFKDTKSKRFKNRLITIYSIKSSCFIQHQQNCVIIVCLSWLELNLQKKTFVTFSFIYNKVITSNTQPVFITIEFLGRKIYIMLNDLVWPLFGVTFRMNWDGLYYSVRANKIPCTLFNPLLLTILINIQGLLGKDCDLHLV